jgi:two-component system sensor histidine kinase BarA
MTESRFSSAALSFSDSHLGYRNSGNHGATSMKKRDLKEWIIVFTIVPTIISGLTLVSYFTVNRFSELTDSLHRQGNNIIEPLAIASESALQENDKRKLKRLIYSSHRKNSSLVNNIAIYNLQRQLVIYSGNQRDLAKLSLLNEQPIPTYTNMIPSDEFLVFYSPIYAEINSSAIADTANEEIIGYIALQMSRDKLMIGQGTALFVSIIVMFCAFILSMLFANRLVRLMIQPIKTMVTAVDAIAQGRSDVNIKEELTGELNQLKNGINTVSRSLTIFHLEMQNNVDQATSDLRETMEQVEIQNVELNLAKRKALEANRVKSEFLANMSHELRTPLNGVIGFTRQLLKTHLKDEQQDYLETIANSANSLLVIINDILDFSKLDAGVMVLEFVPFALRDTINDVLTLMAQSAYDKKLELSIRIAPDTPDDLIADPTRIKQVLVNLIGNAIKFTETGSVSLEITMIERNSNEVSLQAKVIDTGIGIQPKQQESLFAAFGQADSSITRRYGGTGLGLIISQKLALKMKGYISLSSEVGEGSTLIFTFRCKLHGIPLSDQLPILSLANRTVLYYEQEQLTRVAINELLISWGIKVTQVIERDSLKRLLKSGSAFDIAIISETMSTDGLNDIQNLISEIRPFCDSLYLLANTISPNRANIFPNNTINNTIINGCLSKPINHRKLATALAKPYERPPPSLPQKITKTPLKVLAVDDNEANLKLLTTLLLELVESVEVTKNGAQALALCTIKTFDLIFMDIQMPVMDGITACSQIQESSLNETTPIIAVTAHALAGERERLLEVGFNGYLTKPIDEEMLKQSIIEYNKHTNDSESPYLLADNSIAQPDIDAQVAPVHQPLKAPASTPVTNVSNEPEQKPAPEKEKEQEQEQNLPQTPRIDWELGKQRAGGKIALAIDMLNMLLDSLPQSRAEIQLAVDENDTPNILKQVHKLHGACCYAGVPKLKNLSDIIETQLKKSKDADTVMPELFELLDEMDNLLSDCADWRNSQETSETVGVVKK